MQLLPNIIASPIQKLLERWQQLRHGLEYGKLLLTADEIREIEQLNNDTFFCILAHNGNSRAGCISEDGTIRGKPVQAQQSSGSARG